MDLYEEVTGRRECPQCGKSFPAVERRCPHCGANLRTDWNRADYRVVGGCVWAFCGAMVALYLQFRVLRYTTLGGGCLPALVVPGIVAIACFIAGYRLRDHWRKL